MNSKEMLKLIDRINTEPSVLFLGQNYLSTYDGTDIFVETINKELCHDTLCHNASYCDIWKSLNNEGILQKDDFEKMFSVIHSIPDQNWLRRILSMRWGIVFTSAVDSCIAHCVGGDFSLSPISSESHVFLREYMNKNHLHGVYLFGSIDGSVQYPPESCDSSILRRRRKHVNDRISWIYNDIIQGYGVLVIDGWEANKDWAASLLDNATDMPYQSIYLFSASEEIETHQTVQELIEDKKIVLVKESFAQALSNCGFFDSYDETQDSFTIGTDVKTVTIQEKSGKIRYINIPKKVLSTLDNQIVLLDDDLGYGRGPISAEEKGESFAKFLQQDPTSGWQLFTPETGYHFAREVDNELYEHVLSKLQQKKSSIWGTIILEGASNSGKTAALIELGMKLRSEHKCPVFYINGVPSQNQYDGNSDSTSFEEKLRSVIKNYILNPQGSKNVWEERVVVLWDGNVGLDAIHRYKLLSNILMDCSALVIGTAYRHERYTPSQNSRDFDFIHVTGTLSDKEKKELKKVLQNVDASLLDQFEIASNKKQPNLLYTLQQISKYKYSDEWREVSKGLQRHFELEIIDSEQYTGNAIKERLTWEIVNKEINKKGIATAFQMQLAALLEQMQAESDDVSVANDDIQKQKLKHYQHNIQLVNQVLALAGQFSLSLPITLLLRMLSKTPDILNDDNMFIIQLLKNDSLVEYVSDDQGYATARFRHPSEAELYIKSNFGDEEYDRKEKEVELLCSIIENSKWDDIESRSVISLARCFGPNSEGKYSEFLNHRSYNAYFDYWPHIADTLKKYANNVPEAIVVYAHFLREKYSVDRENKKPVNKQYLVDALAELDKVLDQFHNEGIYSKKKNTYYRIVGEKCANLVWQLPLSKNEGPFSIEIFSQLENLYKEAITCDWNSMGNNYFNANSLLDIWLNGVIRYLDSFESSEKALCDENFQRIIANSVSYIERLLIIDKLTSISLLWKIEKINNLASNKTMQGLSEKLNKRNIDTFLFLRAHNCWRNEKYGIPPNPTGIDYIKRNLYLLADNPQEQIESNADIISIKTQAKQSAKNSIQILEENMDLIDRSQSHRCLLMLIRSKWLLYTDHMLLEDNQVPNLSADQWKEMYELCTKYESYCSQNQLDPEIGCELIKGVYLWTFTNQFKEINDTFKELRYKGKNKKWIIERIGLCKLACSELRTFNVDIYLSQSKYKYEARIHREINQTPNLIKNPLEGRKGIYVPDRVLDYLFDNLSAETRNNIQKPVVIWFNLAGPTLGIPEEKKERK